MALRSETLASKLTARFGERLRPLPVVAGDVAAEVSADELLAVCRELRDDAEFAFEQLIDLCGVDYLDYGREEWTTLGSTATGFSRGVNRVKEQSGEPARAR
jgi:NADH-quinone oxidoreductase subunit C